jgi:hypothetical protein
MGPEDPLWQGDRVAVQVNTGHGEYPEHTDDPSKGGFGYVRRREGWRCPVLKAVANRGRCSL